MELFDLIFEKSKKEIYDVASVAGLVGISKLNKKKLAMRLAQALLDEDCLKRLIYIVSEDCYYLLKKAINEKVKLTKANVNAYSMLNCQCLLYENDGFAYLPLDFKNALTKVLNSDYHKIYKEMNWKFQCIIFANDFYGVYTLDDLMGLVKINKFKVEQKDIDEIVYLIDSFRPAFRYLNKYVSCGILDFDLSVLEENQKGKKAFIPTKDQVSFYYGHGYLLNPQYECMKKELIKITDDVLLTEKLLARFFNLVSSGYRPSAAIEFITGNIEFYNADDVSKFIPLLINAYNSTNMIIHKGNAPENIMKVE